MALLPTTEERLNHIRNADARPTKKIRIRAIWGINAKIANVDKPLKSITKISKDKISSLNKNFKIFIVKVAESYEKWKQELTEIK